jgi:hypothetical protein
MDLFAVISEDYHFSLHRSSLLYCIYYVGGYKEMSSILAG